MNQAGLTEAEAQARLDQDGPNRLPGDAPRNLLQQTIGVLSEPMLLLLLAAVAISFTLGEPLEASLLAFSVLVIVAISLFQTRRTDAALSALKSLTAPLATVVREGKQSTISSELLVVGDFVLLREGNRIPADVVIRETTNLAVDESTLTGESVAVSKFNNDLAFAGTLVLSGSAFAEVVSTGALTEVGKIGGMLQRQVETRTPLQLQVDKIVRGIAVAAIITSASVTIIYGLTRFDWLNGGLAGIAAAMSLLPEELPIVLTVFLGLGALRMSRQGVIVRNSPTIETLGSISVLCVDKTGTITENKMKLVVASEQVSMFGALASPLVSLDPTDRAFLDGFQIGAGWVLVREYPLSENQLAVCQVWESGDHDYTLAIKGAPEAVLELCQVEPSQRADQLQEVSKLASQGFRVLGVASGIHSKSKPLPANPADFELEFLGLAGLADPVREGVPDAVSKLYQASVRTIMITGDFPGTASSVGNEVGIKNADQVLTGSDIAAMSDQELIQELGRVNIFSRMLPEQKLRLVELLQFMGETVGMTGDGVNDAPALKRAHVGIAMGKRGSEVAREASDIVVTDDSFTSISRGIAEGRRMFANLGKATAYIIAIHVPLFGLALMPLANPLWPLILLPAQIALLEILIDPAASVAYEAEKASENSMKRAPRLRNSPLLNRAGFASAVAQGMVLLVATSVVFLWTLFAGYSDGQVRLISFTTLLSGNLMLMMTNRSASESLFSILQRGGNRVALVLFAAGSAFLLLIHQFAPIQEAFRFQSVPLDVSLFGAIVGTAPLLVNEALKSYRRRRLRSRVTSH